MMIRLLWRLSPALAIAVAAVSTGDAHALLVIDQISRTVSAQYLIGGAVVTEDSATGPMPDSLTARVNTPLDHAQVVGPPSAEAGLARSVITGVGLSSIELNAQVNSTAAGERIELRAAVSQTIRGGNLLAPQASTLTFSFELKDMFIEIWDAFGTAIDARNPFDGPSDAVGTELRYEVLRDGTAVYRTLLQVWGGRDDDPYLSINAPVPDPSALLISGGGPYNFASDLFAQLILGIFTTGSPGDVPRRLDLLGGDAVDLDLGPIAPFEPFEVTATMSARMLLPAFMLDVGARVGFGDPNALGAFGIGQVGLADNAPVPEPGTVWLLVLGLAGLSRRIRWAAAGSSVC